MGTQIAGANTDRTRLGDSPRNAQHFHFCIDIQTVTRLDLDSGHTLGNQRIDADKRTCQQRFLIRRARRSHRGDNAAASPRDFLIGRALKPHLEFASAVAAMDDVGVAIDKAGRDQTTFKVKRFLVPVTGGNVGGLTAPGDGISLNDDSAVLDKPVSGFPIHCSEGRVYQKHCNHR